MFTVYKNNKNNNNNNKNNTKPSKNIYREGMCENKNS